MASDSKDLNLTTIPASQHFVDVLARHLLAQAGDDPMALARMQVLLPTRRAIRALREAFLRASNGKALLLPIMQPIGDVDEEALGFAAWAEGAMAPDGDDIPPAIPSTRRHMLLARAVLDYQAQQFGTDQAVLLARDLAALLDEAARENVPLSGMKDIVPHELAEHWQLTLNFLQIIIDHWPDVLAAQGVIDPTTRRNLLLARLAAHWRAHPPRHPVIAAGTTGSAPATADLLEVIAGLPNGLVVLPGLDQISSDSVWDAIGEDASHPHYGLHHLLTRMKVDRAQVKPLGQAQNATPREALLCHALWPATVSDGWQKDKPEMSRVLAALAGLHRLEFASQQQEATAIALILREALEVKGRTAALITPNRILARRVAATLQRFHVSIDDSAGIPLSDTAAGIFMRLIAEVVASDAAPVPLLALLKHPLARFGVAVGECRSLARLLELRLLRGVRLKGGFPAMQQALANPDLAIGDLERAKLSAFIARIEAVLAPLAGLDGADAGAWIAAHLAAAEAASARMVWQGEAGEQLASLFAEMQENASVLGAETRDGYPALFAALLAGKTYRAKHGQHPRLVILSPMEARLQHFDRVVLAGLNEGEWPEPAGQDPWMSREMRNKMAFSLPERSIGLSAHDFLMQAAGGEVFLTRAVKSGGAETVPSRWLMRLDAVLGIIGGTALAEQWKSRDAHWQAWAEALDGEVVAVPCAAPEPRPARALRPTMLPVTDVETLLRNPYGIYAKRVLGLRKLDPLDQDPDAADFGTMVHRGIERYLKDESQTLEAVFQDEFASAFERPAIRTFWEPRLRRIAAQFMAQHQAHVAEGAKVESEVDTARGFALPDGGTFTLTARVDRRERLPDGTLRLIDYKTGTVPTLSDVWRGLACQLPLEAVIDGAAVNDLQYWPLKGASDEGKTISLTAGLANNRSPKPDDVKGMDLNNFIKYIERKFSDLIAGYADPATPYRYVPSEADKPRFDDYEHLARVKEWGG